MMPYSLLCLACLITATAFWIRDTVPFLRENDYEPNPRYMYWVVQIFWHFKMAMVFALGPKGLRPIGIFLHGAFLILGFVFWVLAYRSGEFG